MLSFLQVTSFDPLLVTASPGATGAQGQTGPAGSTGPTGPQGLQGPAGDDNVALARNPDTLIVGAVTRDANGAVTSANVAWPDGTPGVFTADVVSTAFPGSVDAYHITYQGSHAKTYTQPLITRDANGNASTVPAITVG